MARTLIADLVSVTNGGFDLTISSSKMLKQITLELAIADTPKKITRHIPSAIVLASDAADSVIGKEVHNMRNELLSSTNIMQWLPESFGK